MKEILKEIINLLENECMSRYGSCGSDFGGHCKPQNCPEYHKCSMASKKQARIKILKEKVDNITTHDGYIAQLHTGETILTKEQHEKLPTTITKIPMPSVKEPKTSIGSLTVEVGVNGMDEAIKQAEALKMLYTGIDILQRRIISGAERVEQVAKHCTKADIAYLVPGSIVLYQDPFDDNNACKAKLLAVVRVEKAVSTKRVGEVMCLIRKIGKSDLDIVDVSDITQI